MTRLPLFPLKNIVLFPGMHLPLHIFEMRYREMIGECIEAKRQFGVVLLREGSETGGGAVPHMVGTAAGIARVERLDDGRLNIRAVGTQRFRIVELDSSRSFLQGLVQPMPLVNGATARAAALAHRVRPRIVEYIEHLARASDQKLRLDRLPEEPMQLALMVAIALQVNLDDKQRMLEKSGVPDLLATQIRLLARETLFVRFMAETQREIKQMNSGATGYLFPN